MARAYSARAAEISLHHNRRLEYIKILWEKLRIKNFAYAPRSEPIPEIRIESTSMVNHLISEISENYDI